MKNNCKFFQNRSNARKINLVIAAVLALLMASSIAIEWHKMGCEKIVCVLGFAFGILFHLAIWSQVDEILE